MLAAIGVTNDMANGALRVSLGEENTKEEIDFLVDNLQKIIIKLRNN